MHAGNGQVQGDLLIWLERQIRQIERVTINQVAVLLQAIEPLGPYRNAFVAEEALVPLERLSARGMLDRIPGHLMADGFEREWLGGVEKDQYQVRHPFESVESCWSSHPREPMAAHVR